MLLSYQNGNNLSCEVTCVAYSCLWSLGRWCPELDVLWLFFQYSLE